MGLLSDADDAVKNAQQAKKHDEQVAAKAADEAEQAKQQDAERDRERKEEGFV